MEQNIENISFSDLLYHTFFHKTYSCKILTKFHRKIKRGKYDLFKNYITNQRAIAKGN